MSESTETKDFKLRIILPILQGLLASGHYTYSDDDMEADESRLIRFDLGDDWKEIGAPCRRMSIVVSDAVQIANELISELDDQ